MKDYHGEKIKTAIDLFKTLIILFFVAVIAFLLVNLFEFLNLHWLFDE